MIRQERPDPSASLSVPTLGSGRSKTSGARPEAFARRTGVFQGREPDLHTELRMERGPEPGEEKLIEKIPGPGADIWTHQMHAVRVSGEPKGALVLESVTTYRYTHSQCAEISSAVRYRCGHCRGRRCRKLPAKPAQTQRPGREPMRIQLSALCKALPGPQRLTCESGKSGVQLDGSVCMQKRADFESQIRK